MFSSDRVTANTPTALNQKIEERIDNSILRTPEEFIADRVDELEREWSVERWIEAHAAAACLAGLGVTLVLDRRLIVVPIAVAGSLLLHGVQGFYPLLPLMRWLGTRTRQELDREKFGLIQRLMPRNVDRLLGRERRRADAHDRVRRFTEREVNRKIDIELARSVYQTVALGPAAIRRRLAELEKEWDIERVLQTVFSSFSLAGLWLGRKRRRWLVLPGALMGLFLQHALQGWCPPVGWLRRLGVRTQREIDREKYALLSVLT